MVNASTFHRHLLEIACNCDTLTIFAPRYYILSVQITLVSFMIIDLDETIANHSYSKYNHFAIWIHYSRVILYTISFTKTLHISTIPTPSLYFIFHGQNLLRNLSKWFRFFVSIIITTSTIVRFHQNHSILSLITKHQCSCFLVLRSKLPSFFVNFSTIVLNLNEHQNC